MSAKCLAMEKKNAGMVPQAPLTAKKPPPVAQMPASHPRVSFSEVDKVSFISPRNKRSREAANLDHTLDKDMEQATAQAQRIVAEDHLARLQILGTLDKTLDPKAAEYDGNQKLPARADDMEQMEPDLEVHPETLHQNDDPPLPMLEEDDPLGAALMVEAFLASDHLPLWNPGIVNPPPIPEHILNPDYNNDKEINVHPNTKMRDDFQAYCRNARKHFWHTFTKVQARSVKLMGTLKRKRAPLDTYDEIMEWHHQENGDINHRQSVKDVEDYISRKKLLKFLKNRYHMTDKFPTMKEIKLPNSKAKVKITRHDAWDCIESILTDPRTTDDDYNFRDNDPFKPPPEVRKIGDLHTAKAYYEAHQKYITDPTRQVLLPFTMYIDGAVTGQFQNLPITALKIALGIHTRKYRDKDHAWRTLGYVAKISKALSRGQSMFAESRHLDADDSGCSDDEGEQDATKQVNKAQDFHTMLACLLESFLDVQKNGFIWDLRYRGQTYKNVEFVPFVIFIKCDTDEADLLCGSYKSRGAGVAQLCRYCLCPTQESDLVNAKFPFKTVEMISLFIETNDQAGLKKMSQQLIQNAWYKVRFHPYNRQGVHGACPSEMLHALLLGVFKYTRDCFFEQIGPTSQLADEINALAQKYGEAFARQSERDMPKCKFKEGIRKGKLMAKEFRGILLVIAAVLRSSKGRELLKTNKNFDNDVYLKDWTILVEMLLEWEAFLNEPEMDFKHVMKLNRKNRYLMYVMKKVARRSGGMGLKLMKFHVIVHMYMDILLFGVPLEVDTGSNESGHKETKIAAKLTQKNESCFDFQTCTRLDEFLVIDLAVAEIAGQRLWEYYTRAETPPPAPPPSPKDPSTGGATINVFQEDKFGNYPVHSLGKGKQAKQPSEKIWGRNIVSFLHQLQTKLGMRRLEIRGEHKRNGQIFRGHPDYRDNHWRDWAMFDWGEMDGTLPGQIWCFVVIDSLLDHHDSGLYHGGIQLANGTYAVVETANIVKQVGEMKRSDIFLPIKKEVAQKATGNRGWRRRFYLADVECIHKPLVVVPDIGGREGIEFFVVQQRAEWVDEFKAWLDDPSRNDIIGEDEPMPSHGPPVI